jgi:hypothetical protein
MLLPAELETKVEQAIAARDGGEPVTAADLLSQALQLAERHNLA